MRADEVIADEDLWSRVTVVTVTYNSESVIEDCLRPLPAQIPVFVIDNASRDRTVELALAERPSTYLFQLQENVGYGRANNFALRQTATEFALLLNPDAFLSSTALAALLRVATANPEYALLAPELDYSNRVSTFAEPADAPTIQDMPEIIGAILLMRMEVGRNLGYFDEDFFLYGDDNDLCTRVREAGWRLGTVRGIVGFHKGNASSGPKPGLQFRKNILVGRAVAHYWRKWRNSRLWWLLCARRVLEHAVKAAVNLLKGKPSYAGRHLGRSIGACLYLITGATGPNHRPAVAATRGAAATRDCMYDCQKHI